MAIIKPSRPEDEDVPPLPVSMTSGNTSGQKGDWWGTQSQASALPSSLPAGAPEYNQRQQEMESTVNWDWINSNLKDQAQQKGVQYDVSDLMDIQRNAGYDQAHLGDAGLYNSQLQSWYENALKKYDERASNVPGGANEGSNDNPRLALGSGPGGGYQGNQFSDPWNKQLEDLINKQLGMLNSPAPGSPQALLTKYLTDQFTELSQANGYTPSEQAILNTQAFEPIEAQRQASQQRALQRAASRGILPTSGLVGAEEGRNDRFYDQMRTVANRDLAVNQINRQNQQRQQALSLVQGLTTNEQGVNDKALQLATLLRQLPIDSLNNSLNVISGSGNPSNLLAQVSQMVAQNQALSQNQSAALWNAIGQAANYFD